MILIASEDIESKIIQQHGVSLVEVEEAFNNFAGYPLVDKQQSIGRNRRLFGVYPRHTKGDY